MKSVKTVAIGLSIVLLSGCFWQKIDNVEIEKAQALCTLYDSKLYYMTESMIGEDSCKM